MKTPLFILWVIAAHGLLAGGCRSGPVSPPGGYDYPTHIADKDTNLFYYPVKDRQLRKDSFYDSYKYLFFKGLDEPNLSHKALASPVYRFVYEGYQNPNTYIITLKEGKIIVKKLPDSSMYPKLPATDPLTSQERFFVDILDRNFPIDHINPYRLRRRNWLDSIGKLYPQLRDPAFYASLLKKEGLVNYRHYNYRFWQIKITEDTYQNLRELIDTSGFWQFPPRLPPENQPIDVFDAAGFILEANTPQKYNMVEGCFCGDDSTTRFESILHGLVKAAHLTNEIYIGDTTAKKPHPNSNK